VAFLLDTNILLRSADPAHPMYSDAVASVATLLAAGETVYIVPQNISEFWNVCTRPLDKNGLGLTPEQTDAEVTKLEALLNLVLDDPQIYSEWRALVVRYSVLGVNVHDARLVAAMRTHGISHILTFNDKDFRRYEPDIKVMTPADVIGTN
jgi:predicted nucleic acid-binding protein